MTPIPEDLTAEIKLLKKRIAGIKGRLTYFKNILDRESNTITHGELKSMHNRIQNIYNKFDDAQSNLDGLLPDEIDNSERFSFENAYGEIDSKLISLLSEKSNTNVEFRDQSLTANLVEHNKVQTKIPLPMPEIQVPQFDGSYISWINFRDIFQNLVHVNETIIPVFKFHYLHTAIRNGKAFQFIEFLPPTAGNYDVAWKRLFEHYENDSRIKKIHIKEIYNIKAVQENSAASLQLFIDTFYKNFDALRALNVDVDSSNLFLTHHLSEKLDSSSRRKIDEASVNYKILKIEEFMNILKNRVQILELNSCSQSNQSNQFSKKPIISNKVSHKSNQSTNYKFGSNQFHSTLLSISKTCPFCNAAHSPFHCNKFINLSSDKRKDLVLELKLCINCFGKDHRFTDCESGVCRLCYQRHHTLLHVNKNKNNHNDKKLPPSNNLTRSANNIDNLPPSNNLTRSANNVDSLPVNSDSSLKSTQNSDLSTPAINVNALSATSPTTVSNHVHNTDPISQVLLFTAVIWVKSDSGYSLPCRIVIDPGSMSNLVTEKLCQKLHASKHSTHYPISGILGNVSYIKNTVDLIVQSRVSDFSASLSFLVAPTVTADLPLYKVKFDQNKIPSSIQLGDPKFHIPQQIDMLIGAEIYSDIILGDRIKIIPELPPFHNSVFGYVLNGRVPISVTATTTVNNVVTLHCSNETLNSSLQKFWELEEIKNPTILSIEEKMCNKHYSDNVRRLIDGRYSVALPIKTNSSLGQNYKKSLGQFMYQERNLTKNPNIQLEYNKFMNEYLSLHHMEKVASLDPSELSRSYFLPHHSVLKPTSTTTKLRVVFNGSAKTSNNKSLNDTLMVGPTIQEDLFSIIIRFRKYIFGFTADITKMYRQIMVHPEYRHLQRIWWRENDNDQISCFQLCTVTYGTASAPFLAIRTLKQLANDERKNYPNAAVVLERDFYVDDAISGTNNKSDLKNIKSQLTELLARGGFELCKWVSNCKEIIPDDSNADQSTCVLGIMWNTHNDTITPSIGKYHLTETLTKRCILSGIAQTFDPLGLFAPVTFTAKVFMQKLWQQSSLSWDDPLPQALSKYWSKFIHQLQSIQSLSVPRCVVPIPNPISIEIHGFGDASERGYGCCIYIKCADTHNNYHVSLLCAKSKVAPLKNQTIPRLELCASLLLAQLYNKVQSVMNMKFDKVQLWTDSEITLHRIKSSPSKYVIFVANRVAQIQELTSPEMWYFVPTQFNPADVVSRGLMPSELENTTIWWQGPHFLKENKIPFQQPFTEEFTEDTELRKAEITLISTETHDLIERYSDVNKLLRITTLCRRFINNSKLSAELSSNRIYGPITALELDETLKCLIKVTQHYSYKQEIIRLKNEQTVSRKSSLIKLNPFIDANGIIRVGGRLKHADLPYDQKHNILLPSHHTLSILLARREHHRNLHCGPQDLLNTLRQRFWLINGRKLCRKIVHDCIRCFRVKPTNINQLMGELPTERVTPSKAFSSIGIDFCGPFNITSKIRSNTTSKVYIALFICFATKATHLEIVSDLTTVAFLASLRRFVSRRGRPSSIYTDNATNFVGAQSELQTLVKLFENELHQHDVLKYCSENSIQWKTIPARSPHFAGLWESAIKSAKHHLRRTLFNSKFTFEELQTVTNQVEACLNSRPLSPVSSDPSDFTVLTPGHFLIGCPLNAIPDPSLEHLNFNRLSRWQKLQYNLQTFWKRWSSEYLCELQQRNKWTSPTTNVKLNSLVLLKDDNVPPMKWIIGRIVAVHPGNDSYIRVVTVRTSLGEFKRAINRICLLPFEDKSADDIEQDSSPAPSSSS